MKNTNQYINDIRNQMQTFRNASGGGPMQNSPYNVGRRTPGWNANGGANARPDSPQIIIQVTNNSTAPVSNFDVFGAGEYLYGNYGGGSWSNSGDFTLNNVTITSVFNSVSYQQVLANVQNNPFTAGSVYMESVSGSTQQVADVYQLTSVNQSGESYTKPIKPYKDAYQFQNGITYNNNSFNMGTLTKLTWTTIYASAVFQISIFPSQIIDPNAALNGGNVQQAYSKPNVIGNLR